MKVFKEKTPGNSLAVQWIEFHASTEGETVRELRSHMLNAWHGQNKQTNKHIDTMIFCHKTTKAIFIILTSKYFQSC